MLTHRLRTMGAAAAVLATIIALLALTGYQGAAAQGQARSRLPRTPWPT